MDDKTTLGRNETGSKAALPIWMNIAKRIHEGLPPVDFEPPPEILMVSIDPKTGVRVSPDTPGAVVQAFISGTEPSSVTDVQVNQQGLANIFQEGAGVKDGGGAAAIPEENVIRTPGQSPAAGDPARSSSPGAPVPVPPRSRSVLDPFRAGSTGQ